MLKTKISGFELSFWEVHEFCEAELLALILDILLEIEDFIVILIEDAQSQLFRLWTAIFLPLIPFPFSPKIVYRGWNVIFGVCFQEWRIRCGILIKNIEY